MGIKIEVLPHNPLYTLQFSHLKFWLQHELRGVPVLAIEHIGSTAIPGLVAKPIIDIDVVVRAEHVPAAVDALRDSCHWSHKGECGIPGRHSFRPGRIRPVHNLYVCVDGCLGLRAHLAVKRVLLGDGEMRRRYGEVKMELAKVEWLWYEQYNEAKNGIIEEIMAKGGISEEERRELIRGKDALSLDGCLDS
ncbi:MAG: hypothetical protein Q9214_001354 [Letrouitia sp. 1 TL-2023]